MGRLACTSMKFKTDLGDESGWKAASQPWYSTIGTEKGIGFDAEGGYS